MLLILYPVFIVSAQKYVNMAGHKTSVYLNGIYGEKKTVFEDKTIRFLDAINMAYKTHQRPVFPPGIVSEEAGSIIEKLWRVSPFLSVSTEIVENAVIVEGGDYEIRNIQVVFDESKPGYEQQDAVIFLDPSGKIVDFKIALGYHSIASILKDTISVTDLRRRQMIISFVEDFRTAYNLRDTAYLNKMFSDKALIITGKILYKTIESEMKPIVEYRKQTKVQYLSNLAVLFRRVRILDVRFDSVIVVSHPTNVNLYGVTLTQTWNSEYFSGGKYNDTGYVFLIIDFTNEQNPKIWVRTWQDKKYIEADHGIFSFDHFSISNSPSQQK